MKYAVGKTVLLVTLLFICQQGIAQANKKHSFSINFGPKLLFQKVFLQRHIEPIMVAALSGAGL